MKTHDLADLLRRHKFLQGLDESAIALMVGCASNVHFDPGAYILREGAAADHFYLIRKGRVALEMAVPGRAPVIFLTIGEGQILGASWLFPPYVWQFDARAVESTQATAFAADCLRDKCEADPGFGYALMKRFVPILASRLQATRMQLVDLYRSPGAA